MCLLVPWGSQEFGQRETWKLVESRINGVGLMNNFPSMLQGGSLEWKQ